MWAYLMDGIQLAFGRLEVVWVLSTGRASVPINLGYIAGKALDSQIAAYLATCLGQIQESCPLAAGARVVPLWDKYCKEAYSESLD